MRFLVSSPQFLMKYFQQLNKCLLRSDVFIRQYNSRNGPVSDSGMRIIDMRSDVLTKPTDEMRKAMAEATVGDDVFNEDPTVHELQDKMAKMLGMEAALYVPSGTMGNLISVLCHCNKRGLEAIFGHMAHLVMYEQGGVAQLGGVVPRTIPNKADGTFDLDLLDDYIRPLDDPHQPHTGLITVENTHGNCGGKVLSLEFLGKLRHKANQWNIPVHMDGARVFNAAVTLDVELAEILQYVDSVSVCLSKGVGAPIGSVIGGSAQLIAQAVRLRKVLGGGWRKPGPLAAAALVALSSYRDNLALDHKHAKLFAQGVMEKHNNIVHINVDGIHTNIVMIDILKPGLTAEQFCQRLSIVSADERRHLGHEILVLARPARMSRTKIRCYFHLNIDTDDVLKAVNKMHYVIKSLL